MARKKDIDYYSLFAEAIEYSCKISEKLISITEDYYERKEKPGLEERIEEIHKLEHEADMLCSNIVLELNRAFMTPIEREDILNIIYNIDNITDSLEDVSYRFWMFNIGKIKPEVKQFFGLIDSCCKKVQEAVIEFKNFKKSKVLLPMVQEISKFENEADTLYHTAIRNLFINEKDPIELLKWRETFHDIEKFFDRCNILGKVLESAMVKNS